MLYKINLLILFILFSISTFSQSKFGIETGMTISSIQLEEGDHNTTKPYLGLKTGINYQYQINKVLGLGSGIFYVQKGERNSYVDYGIYNGQNLTYKKLESYKLNYLELPLFVNLKLKNLTISGGLYFSKSVSSSYNIEVETYDSQSGVGIYSSSEKKDLLTTSGAYISFSVMYAQNIDYGLNFGLAYQLGRFTFKSNFDLGLPAAIQEEVLGSFAYAKNEYKNRSLSLSLSYDLFK